MEPQRKKMRVLHAGGMLGGLLGAVLAGMRVWAAPTDRLAEVAGVFMIPIWLIVGLCLGEVIQYFASLRLRRPIAWEAGAMHKVVAHHKDDSSPMKNLFSLLSLLAVLLTLGLLGLFGAAMGLVFLPVVLQ